MQTNRLQPPKPEQQYLRVRWGFVHTYVKKYGAFLIFRFMLLAVILLVAGVMTFVGGYTQKPRGTGEVLQMTLGTGLLLLAFAGMAWVVIRRIRGPNPRDKTPAGLYPDPLGIRRLRWFNGTDWTDAGAGAHLRPAGAATFQPTSQPAPAPAGWYPDPAGSARLRYFNGGQWTDNYSQQPPAR